MQKNTQDVGLVGTYDSDEHQGLYRFTFSEQEQHFTSCMPFVSCSGAKCAAYVEDKVITVFEDKKAACAGILLFDNNGRLLDRFSDEKVGACFIKADRDLVYTANYHDGTVFVYRIVGAKIELVKKITVQAKAGCHQVIRRDNLLLVPCLLLDCINIYAIDDDYALCGELPFTAGTGPRHGIFSRDLTNFYLVSELGNELFHFSWPLNAAAPFLRQTIAYLPKEAGKDSASAAIRLSRDERFLYVSTRGSDLLSVFELRQGVPRLVQQLNCGGSHPRDFILTASGKYLLVANRLTNDLVAFTLADGKIATIVDQVHVPNCIGIVLEESGEKK